MGQCREVSSIRIFGNNITRADIIIREVQFKEGDTLCINEVGEKMEISRQQIMNTRLFNEVNFRLDTVDAEAMHVIIEVKERWYVWPIPKIEVADRNFNQWWLTRDLSRINIGLSTVIQNVRGRNETLRINLMTGYTQLVGLDYYFPFINKRKTIGLGIGGDWMANREIWYITRNDKVQFFQLDDAFAHQKWEANARLVHRPHFYSTHTLGLKVGAGIIADTVLSPELNPLFFSNGQTRQRYVGIQYRLIKNRIDFINYPLKGYISELQADYLLMDGGSSPSLGIIRVNHRRFTELAEGFFGAAGIYGGLNISRQLPYHASRALGYRDFIRGFEYYVADGSAFIMVKTNLRMRLFPQLNFELPLISHPKFKKVPVNAYLGPYFDAGYVNGRDNLDINTLPDKMLFGTGLGLDITSYYDRVMRIEYSYNSLGEWGWFVHFRKSI